MHDVLVGDVRVGEVDLVDLPVGDQAGEAVLGDDRDPLWVARPGERWRVGAVVDAGNLGRREGDHLGLGLVAVDDVEVVEVPPSGPHDHHSSHRPDSLGTAATRRCHNIPMLLIAALGDNALPRGGWPADLAMQRANAAKPPRSSHRPAPWPPACPLPRLAHHRRLAGCPAFATWEEAGPMEVPKVRAGGASDMRSLGVKPAPIRAVLQSG